MCGLLCGCILILRAEEEKVVDPNALEIDESEPPAAADAEAAQAAAEKAKAEAEAAEKAKEEARRKQEEEDDKAVPKDVSLLIAARHARDQKVKNMV